MVDLQPVTEFGQLLAGPQCSKARSFAVGIRKEARLRLSRKEEAAVDALDLGEQLSIWLAASNDLQKRRDLVGVGARERRDGMIPYLGAVVQQASQTGSNKKGAEVIKLFQLLSVKSYDDIAMVGYEADQAFSA